MSHSALAKPPTVVPSVGLALPFTRAEIEAQHAEQAPVLAEYMAITAADIESDDDLKIADEYLTDAARMLDEVVKTRQAAVKPVKGLVQEVEAWFRPFVKELETAKDHLRGVIGAYRTRKFEEAEALKRQAVTELEETGNVNVEALTQAAALTERDAGKSTTRYAWAVKRVAIDLLPQEYHMPDMKKIETFAKGYPGEGDPPVIPGVVFERTAIVGAKIK